MGSAGFGNGGCALEANAARFSVNEAWQMFLLRGYGELREPSFLRLVQKPKTDCFWMKWLKLSAQQESLWRHGVVHDPAKRKQKVTYFHKVSSSLFILSHLFLHSLQRGKPKKEQAAQTASQSPTDDEETTKLAAKLACTSLVENKS